jgi:autotransporter passenger strand-loop-strand repeat protein
VEFGGIASGMTIGRGGLEYVSSRGIASGTTINRGTLEVALGGSTGSGPITFTSAGGDLQLDASQSFDGLIAGFASPHGVTEEIDLRDIAFGKGTKVSFTEAGNHLSGTLTVTDGTGTPMRQRGAIRDRRSYIRTAEETYEIRPAGARCIADW